MLDATMPFGKYKNWPLRNIPDDYLAWLHEKCDLRWRLRQAVADELERREMEQARMRSEARAANAGPGVPVEQVKHSVRSCYREMSLRFHPDRGGTVEQMQTVNAFHERLLEVLGI
jgi:predicted transcriptional regulator